MTIGVHQPYFFPYLPYFQLIKAVDKFVLLDDVNYINKGFINRNEILGTKFTIPLVGASQNKIIKDLEVVDRIWLGEFLDKIVKAYTGSPYFTTVWLMLDRILLSGAKKISEINYLGIKEVCAYLNIDTQIVFASTNYPKEAPGQYRILHICKQEKATRYINAQGGKEIYNKELFNNNGIELKFLKGTPSLSMIDLLMRYSQDDIKHLLYAYELE